MAHYAYFVDLSICAGCESCTVACQNKNELAPNQAFTKVRRFEAGTFPAVTSTFVTTQCMHCDNPPCAEACPTGATYKEAEGPVTVDTAKCISCKYCITACPYEARVVDEDERVVRKCTMCFDRLQAGQQPACVQTCLTGARMAGDLDDPKSPIHQAIAQANVHHIEGTSFYYRLPETMGRAVLPADFDGSPATYAWQSIFQPVGQVMLGGVMGAVLVSLASNLIQARKKGGDKAHGDHGKGD
ncbi:MAG TPA: 4Fe-4S dicluster domain-containing protein [Symbiobacteriaceae bacterium]|nr:4Fe-4S dicluster domain-containing protein [Symbiobacteriaceae bacterium]